MKTRRILSSCLISFLASTLFCHAVPAGYVLQWSDEFTNNTLNTNYWNYSQTNRRSAYNTPSAVSVTNGCLVITTYTEGGTNFTGFIDTANKVANSYGYYEASIQFSNAPGNWSAFWLQSPFVGNTNNNPTNGVEIDIFEHRDVDGGGNQWVNGGDSALHWDGYGAFGQGTIWSSSNLGVGSGFHTYGLLWTTNSYTFYVDGNATWTPNYLVSSAPEFIRLTSEVESNSWAGTVPGGSYPDLPGSPFQMLVDYVRYYAPPVSPVLNRAATYCAGAFALSFSGANNQSYRVLASTNLMLPLTNWLVLTNGTFGTSMVSYTDTAATKMQEFYRVTSP